MAAELFVGRPFTGVFWGLEAVHSVLIAAICFLIFYKTRELQELSQHKGIGSFRKTFLFFGLASLVKLATRHLVISFFLYPGILGIADSVVRLGVTAVIYAYTMAAFYLLYSVLWKDKRGFKSRPAMLHLAALAIALVVGLTSLSRYYFLFQLLVIAYSIAVIQSKPKKAKSQLLVIYELLLVAWLLSLVDSIMYISQPMQIGVYAVSTTVFLLILQQVSKRLGVVKNGKKA